jgi:hypothetical protein
MTRPARKLRRLDPLPGGRWLGAVLYDPPKGPDAPLPETDRPSIGEARTLGMGCAHTDETCPVWRARRGAT